MAPTSRRSGVGHDDGEAKPDQAQQHREDHARPQSERHLRWVRPVCAIVTLERTRPEAICSVFLGGTPLAGSVQKESKAPVAYEPVLSRGLEERSSEMRELRELDPAKQKVNACYCPKNADNAPIDCSGGDSTRAGHEAVSDCEPGHSWVTIVKA